MVVLFPTQGRHQNTSVEPQVTVPRPLHWDCSTTSIKDQEYCSSMDRQWVISPWHHTRLGSHPSQPPCSLFSCFLQDDQVHFAHPIIVSTTKSFYFNKWHKISIHDQDTFRGSVLKPLVALVGTVVHVSRLYSIPFADNMHNIEMHLMNSPMATLQLQSSNKRLTNQFMMKSCAQWLLLRVIQLMDPASINVLPNGQDLEREYQSLLPHHQFMFVW